MSLRVKTIFLSVLIIMIITAIGSVGILAVSSLSESLGIISTKSLPAVRNMTLVDMMHDGVRATVYRSLMARENEKEEIRQEFKEFSASMRTYLKELEQLGTNEEVTKLIQQSGSNIEKFLADAEVVISASLTDDKEAATTKLPEFISSFELLEKDLEVIGELIETNAKNSSTKSQENAEFFKKLSFYMVGIGVFFAIVISYFAYSFMAGLTNKINAITKNLENESTHVYSTSNTMADVAGKMSEAGTEQAASLQQTVASIDEISAMVTRNAESAVASTRISDESKMIAIKGKDLTQKMVNSITTISTGNDAIINQMQHSNQEISEIVKVIENIGLKTQVINDIVFQTKLLSFNASVEAARAGEHGKGFSVVAEEVGNLASMSGKAAAEITEILTQSVSKVTGIVNNTKSLVSNLINESKNNVDQGKTTAVQCSEALNEILLKVTSVNEKVQEISTASQEQSIGVSEINKAMSELDQLTQANSVTAEKSARAAKDLQKRAENLNSLVHELTFTVTGKKQILEKHSNVVEMHSRFSNAA